MERFVRLVVAGGPALVAGLWLAELSGQLAELSGPLAELTGTTAGHAARWTLVAGVVLALSGAVALAAGVEAEIEWRG